MRERRKTEELRRPRGTRDRAQSDLENLLGLCLLTGLALGGLLVFCAFDQGARGGPMTVAILMAVIGFLLYMGGRLRQALLSVRTELRQHHRALLRSRAELRLILDGSPDIILHLDEHGRCLFSNVAWHRLLGLAPPTGRPLGDVVHPEDRTALETCLSDVAHERREATGVEEVRVSGKGGHEHRLQVHLHRAPNPRNEHCGTIAVLRDVTEQRAAREEAAGYRNQLLQVQKMESLGTLAGGIAHDFNNLLGAILGFASHASSQIASDDPLARPLRIIEKSAARGADLTQRLLAFARRAPQKLREVHLRQVLENLEIMLRHTLDKRIDLQVGVEGAPPPVAADASQIEQALLNLCLNAQDAMTDGGRLTVTGRRAEEEERTVVVLTVADTGPGIPPEIQGRIFDPFFTTKAQGKGTGLGLSVVWGVAHNHGGSVHVVSREGRGTTFKMILPAAEPEPNGTTVEQPLVDLSDRPGCTILVAEDEPSLRNLLETVLAPLGYRLLLAANGWEALEQFERHAASIDLVILDLVMPEVSGPQVFRQIQNSPHRPRFLITSGYSEEARVDALLEEGADAFIAKPYDVTDLLTKVRELLSESARA